MTARMPGLAAPATIEAMVAFIRTRLVKTVTFRSGEQVSALSETAARFNDTSWFWTDDNAKAAELLCEPSIYEADPAAADGAIDFVLRMSQGAVIQRRGGPAELRAVSSDPAAFRVETAFVILEGDLTRGVVRHALRFNDGRTVTAAEHTGRRVRWRRWGMRFGAEPAITGFGVETAEGIATAWHTSAFRFGTMRTTYTVRADWPSVGVAVELVPAPGVVLADVVLSTGLERLGTVPDVVYRALSVQGPAGDRMHRGVAAARAGLHAGPASYAAVVQEGASPGFSYAVHCLLVDGARLLRITSRSCKRGKRRRLDRVDLAYALGRVAGPIAVREERMVTGGGYYDLPGHYAAVMREGLGGGEADPSMSYDIGAELNAVAVHVLFACRGRYKARPEAGRLEALTAWYDRHLERYFSHIRPDAADAHQRAFTRGVAFVVLSLDCMVRATGAARYRAWLAVGVRLMLGMQRRRDEGEAAWVTFGDVWAGHYPFLDNHAACLLALARAAWHGDAEGAIGQAVREGIRGIRLHAGVVDVGAGNRVAYEGLAVVNPADARPHADSGFWTYKLGMTMRALHACVAAADAGGVELGEADRRGVALRLAMARHQIEGSMRRDGALVEVLTSRMAGETNSETQPWVALGLWPGLDEQIVALAPPPPLDPVSSGPAVPGCRG